MWPQKQSSPSPTQAMEMEVILPPGRIKIRTSLPKVYLKLKPSSSLPCLSKNWLQSHSLWCLAIGAIKGAASPWSRYTIAGWPRRTGTEDLAMAPDHSLLLPTHKHAVQPCFYMAAHALENLSRKTEPSPRVCGSSKAFLTCETDQINMLPMAFFL